MDNDEHNREALALDALDALDGEELRTLRAHLASCAECVREREALRAAASMLAYAAPHAAPGAHVRARLMERVREMGPAAAPSAGAPDAPAPQTRAPEAEASPDDARALEFNARTRAGGGGVPKWFALAASLVIAVMAVALAALWRQNAGLRGEVARVGAQLDAERGRGAQQQEAVEQERRRLVRAGELSEVLASPEVRMAALAGTKDAPPGARASLAYDRVTSRAVLVASGLPPAPEGKAYQVWYIDAGRPPVPGGTFKPDVDSRGFLSDRIPPEGLAAQTFAVTLEPEGGVPAPTGKMYLLSAAS